MMRNFAILLVVGVGLLVACVLTIGAGTAQTQTQPASEQATYDTPEAAVDAMALAVATRDGAQLRKIFGPRTPELASGNARQDAADMQRLSAALQRGYLLKDAPGGVKQVLVGPRGWLFPAPLVQKDGHWRFDTDTGIEEVLDRRVGRNELDAIATCHYLVAAQHLFFRMDADDDKVHCYAARLASSPGKRDGLYWPAEKDQLQSPLGPLVAAAIQQGELKQDAGGVRQAYRGYFYKVLTRQGPAASGGEMNYLDANGRMTAGFGLLAWPAQYGRTGVMSFMVAKDGVVYQADLGEDTPKTAESLTSFNPDDRWKPVKPPEEKP